MIIIVFCSDAHVVFKNELSPYIVKKEIQYFAVPEEEQWGISYNTTITVDEKQIMMNSSYVRV